MSNITNATLDARALIISGRDGENILTIPSASKPGKEGRRKGEDKGPFVISLSHIKWKLGRRWWWRDTGAERRMSYSFFNVFHSAKAGPPRAQAPQSWPVDRDHTDPVNQRRLAPLFRLHLINTFPLTAVSMGTTLMALVVISIDAMLASIHPAGVSPSTTPSTWSVTDSDRRLFPEEDARKNRIYPSHSVNKWRRRRGSQIETSNPDWLLRPVYCRPHRQGARNSMTKHMRVFRPDDSWFIEQFTQNTVSAN